MKSNQRFRQIISVIRKYDLNSKNFKPENLRKACEELGPSFVKLGQMAAMRSDIISPEICSELLKLCNNVAPMSREEVENTLRNAYQKPVEEVFVNFDYEPHGSASLAQVHYAELPSGEKVAVKVQRPNIQREMMDDIDAIESMVKQFSRFKLVETLDLKTLVRVFRETTTEELNFFHEARNIDEYRENNKDVHYCQVPEVYWDLCMEKVLVMERVDGPHIGDFEELRKECYDLEDLTRKYLKNMCKQVMFDGLCHYDPHPANLKIRDGKIVWLDWGMAGHFSSGERELLKRLSLAIADNDAVTFTECLALINTGTEPLDKITLYNGLKDILSKANLSDVRELDIVAYLTSLINLLRRSHIVLPSKFVMLLRSFSTMEALALELYPDADFAELFIGALKDTVRENSDNKDEINKWLGHRKKDLQKILTIPVNLADIMHNMASGLSTVKIDVKIPEDTKDFFTWMTYALIQGLIVIALIIGASIVTTAHYGPMVFGIPVLGFIGYVTALILIILINISNLMRRKKK